MFMGTGNVIYENKYAADHDEPFRNLLCCYFVMADWAPQ